MEDKFATILSSTGELNLAYQSFGDENAPGFLLVTGWFSDMTLWPRGFCEELAARGFRVIRYDNRDAGLSARTDVENIDLTRPPYTMSDLAADAVGLLDTLGIPAAHVAGFAMGGTIAQFIAIEHPERVLSLAPMATASGARGFTLPGPSIISVLREPFPTDTEGLARHHKKLFAAMAGSSFDEVDYEERRGESIARGASPARGDLQSMANATSGDRTERLGQVRVPVLVVHAEQDPLVSLEAAQTQVNAFPNAELLVLEGIGHGVLPRRHWPKLADALQELASRAG